MTRGSTARIIEVVRSVFALALLAGLVAILLRTLLTHDALRPLEQAAMIVAVVVLLLGLFLVSGVRSFRRH